MGTDERDQKNSIRELGEIIYKNAVEKGFYDNCNRLNDPIWISNRLMLIVSELAEGLEGVRKGNITDMKPGNGGLAEELADACIRIFDLAYSLSIDLDNAIKIKMEYNTKREFKHGNKAI